MNNDESITPADQQFARVLGGLQPVRSPIDRDRLMFRAGQVSSRHRLRIWQGAVGLLVVGLGLSLALRPAPPTPGQVIRYVQVERPARETREVPRGTTVQARTPTAANADYLILRKHVLDRGIEALPAYRAPAPDPVIDELRTSLQAPAGSRSSLQRPSILGRFFGGNGT